MTLNEYFGDWMSVLDKAELSKIMNWLKTCDKSLLSPSIQNVFKAFKLCSLHDCKAIFIGQDVYPQKGVATGILFGNSVDTPEDRLSPSLKIIKEACINYEIPHNLITFDNSLESWARQGILMINSALTCSIGLPDSHAHIWRQFMRSFLRNMRLHPGIIYVLFGSSAKDIGKVIDRTSNDVIEIEHPAFFARNHLKMPYSVFTEINDLMYGRYGEKFKWYNEST